MVARKAPRCGCGARPREAQRFAGAGIPGPGITPHCRRACQYRHERAETNDITGKFKIGDHVGWNSEAGRVSGRIIKRSEEHTSELQSLMRLLYAVFCLKKKKVINQENHKHTMIQY